MSAPTISWYHSNGYKADDAGVIWNSVSWDPASPPKAWGGWAEPTDYYGYYAPHSSCTPTQPGGHCDSHIQLVGTFLSYNDVTGQWMLNFGFTCPSSGMIRMHLWMAV